MLRLRCASLTRVSGQHFRPLFLAPPTIVNNSTPFTAGRAQRGLAAGFRVAAKLRIYAALDAPMGFIQKIGALFLPPDEELKLRMSHVSIKINT